MRDGSLAERNDMIGARIIRLQAITENILDEDEEDEDDEDEDYTDRDDDRW